MIDAVGLSKSYGGCVAIDNLSFQVRHGEAVGLLGPNGSGKTTTLRILAGSMASTHGQARVCGHDVQHETLAVQRCIGYLPENPPLYLALTVREYLHFIATLKGLRGRDRRIGIEAVLEQAGLGAVAGRLLQNLSHGYRQRTALAQALLAEPRVLILDEPTSALDPRQAEELRALLRGLAQERTVVLSTHRLHDVVATCQRALILHRGRLVADVSLGAAATESLEQTFLRLTA